MIVDSTLISCLSWRALPPSIHPSSQVIRYRKFIHRRVSHAMLLFLPRAWYGFALFLVLFNRCRVPLFPVRESPSALSGRARILMSGWLFKFIFTLCIFIFSKA
ncbi:unnamed protein product, partial [Vitis vinifera]|uniref:Uncharacterized protein n=1 Tax=Vitis vinifera TaxID=29760 RepID=D7SZ19_VITVI